METVWKNTVIDITVLVTMVIVVSCIVFMVNGATPVWADTATTDIYEIPEEYASRNYVVQDRYTSTGKQYITVNGSQVSTDAQTIIDYTYDFTVYYPTDYLFSLELRLNSYGKFGFNLRLYNQDNSIFCGYSLGSELKFDGNNVAQANVSYYLDGQKYNLPIYVKKNNCIQHSLVKTTDYGIFENDIVLSLSSLSESLRKESFLSINYPFYLNGTTTSSGYSYYYSRVYSGIYDNSHVIQEFKSNTNDNTDIKGAVVLINRFIENNKSDVFPKPTLNKVNKTSDTTLHCYYDYPTQGRTPNFMYVYPKVFVKVKGNENWTEYQNIDDTQSENALGFSVYKLKHDSSNKMIWGNLSLYALYERMGYTEQQINSEDFEPPKIEGIIWGVQYGYALFQNILDESSIRKSKIVFSRYVFEDNIVDTPDVGIGDLGDLPNISGSTSNIEVGTGSSGTSGGSLNRPGGGHNVPDKDSTSFIDLIINGKLNFSSIGEALSSLFSMVSGFASAVGAVLGAVFGNTFGLIALCAVGAVIVLRVLGR